MTAVRKGGLTVENLVYCWVVMWADMTAAVLVHRTVVSKDNQMVGRLAVLSVEQMAVGTADLKDVDLDSDSVASTAALRAVNSARSTAETRVFQKVVRWAELLAASKAAQMADLTAAHSVFCWVESMAVLMVV